jgi:hypothetical protein
MTNWQPTPTEWPQSDASVLPADDLADQIDQLEANGTDADKGEARRLRKEVAKFRAAKDAAEAEAARYAALTELHEGDAAAVLRFAQLLGEDPGQAAAMAVAFGRSLAEVSGADFNELAGIPAGDTTEPEPDEDVPADLEGSTDMALTDEQIQAMVEQQVQAALSQFQQTQTLQQQLMNEVRALGYEPDVDDPRTYALLSLAAKNDGDLEKAHEVFTSTFGAADAPPATGDTPESTPATSDELVPAPDGVPASGNRTIPTTLAEAAESAESRFLTMDGTA